jgi:dihydrofolate synthase/folylpolyglutamate synthase
LVLADVLRNWRDKPAFMIVGMLNTKEADGFLQPMVGLIEGMRTVSIPDEEKSYAGSTLAKIAIEVGHHAAKSCDSLTHAVGELTELTTEPGRITICGSLYLAGRILRDHQ